MNWKKQWLKLKNKFGRLSQEEVDGYTKERNRKINEEEKEWMQKYKERMINNEFKYLETANKVIEDIGRKTDVFSKSKLDTYLTHKALAIVHLIDICCDFETKRHIVIHWSL